MKAFRHFYFLPALLVMLVVAAGQTWWFGEEIGWLLPGMAFISLAVCWSLPGRIWVAGTVMLLLIAVYACNPSHRWVDRLGLEAVRHVAGLPASAYPAGSWQAGGMALAMLAAYGLAFRLSENQVCWLQGFVTLAAAAMALLVLSQRLEPKLFPVFPHTGLFVNENHFAVFANLALPVALAQAARSHFRAVQDGRPASPAGIQLLIAVLLGAAVVLSHSRAGILVMLLVVVACAVCYGGLVRLHPFAGAARRYDWRWMAAGAILAALSLAVMSFAREWHQVGDVRRELDFRWGIVKDTAAMCKVRPAWGMGPGTFPIVYPYYQSPVYATRVIRHAHCEPVEFVAEYGWVGGGTVLLAVGWALSARKPKTRHREIVPAFAELERRFWALGLMAGSFHCLVDFPLRDPLIAIMAATWAGVWAGQRPAPAGAGCAKPGLAEEAHD